ncbi:MAG: DUF4262 domain-containing protein [Solirubrobacteraceae bacterium]
MSDDWTERSRQLMLTRIAEHGYAFQQIISAEPYAYTLGLPAYIGHPELVVCGTSPHFGLAIVKAVVAQLRSSPALDGRVRLAGEDGLPLWIAELPHDVVGARLAAARWWRKEHHDGRPVSAKQIIICDPESRFPWEAGCRRGYARPQAVLLPAIAERQPAMTVQRGRGQS